MSTLTDPVACPSSSTRAGCGQPLHQLLCRYYRYSPRALLAPVLHLYRSPSQLRGRGGRLRPPSCGRRGEGLAGTTSAGDAN